MKIRFMLSSKSIWFLQFGCLVFCIKFGLSNAKNDWLFKWLVLSVISWEEVLLGQKNSVHHWKRTNVLFFCVWGSLGLNPPNKANKNKSWCHEETNLRLAPSAENKNRWDVADSEKLFNPQMNLFLSDFLVDCLSHYSSCRYMLISNVCFLVSKQWMSCLRLKEY